MSDNKEYLTFSIRRYMRNLLLALLGNDPYRMELDEAREKLKIAVENMKSIQNQYCSALEKWDESQQMLEKANHALEVAMSGVKGNSINKVKRYGLRKRY